MQLLTTQNSLIPFMAKCFRIKNNTWYKDKDFPEYYRHSLYPHIYTTLKLLNKVSLKLFGVKGNIHDKKGDS